MDQCYAERTDNVETADDGTNVTCQAPKSDVITQSEPESSTTLRAILRRLCTGCICAASIHEDNNESCHEQDNDGAND